MADGYYYLHENKKLIYKSNTDNLLEDLLESDFVKAIWPVDSSNRSNAWTVLIEASILGALEEDILRLKDKWHCTDQDAFHFAKYSNFDIIKHSEFDWEVSNQYYSKSGVGNNSLTAMIDFCKKFSNYCQINQASKRIDNGFLQLLNGGES
jgi:hypothetical protein